MTDITEHEWSDSDIFEAFSCKGDIKLVVPKVPGGIDINKSDAIAIAKHFGLFDDLRKHLFGNELITYVEGEEVIGEDIVNYVEGLGK